MGAEGIEKTEGGREGGETGTNKYDKAEVVRRGKSTAASFQTSNKYQYNFIFM